MFDSFLQWWADAANSLMGLGDQVGVSQSTAQAIGFNPASGTFIAPQYAETFAKLHPGVDPSAYVSTAQTAAVAQFNTDTTANFQELGGYSFLPFSPVVGGDAQAFSNVTSPSGLLVIAIVLVLGFFLIKAVK